MKPTLNHHLSSQLRENRQRLFSKMDAYSGAELVLRNSQLLDDYFRDSFQLSQVGPRLHINRNPYAIIALGGYGRQEQCLHSDVDILFLFQKKVPRDAEALIREIVFPLWDIGLTVGHATRSIRECFTLAKQELEILTSLLDARLICGMSFLYSELMEALMGKLIRPQAARLIRAFLEEGALRQRLFGDSASLLEPNLKSGHGGLRDYHNLLWMGCIQHGWRNLKEFEYSGYLSHQEHQLMQEALNFIWGVRNRLHSITGRCCDQLFYDYQLQVAEALSYRPHQHLLAVEVFLSDLHRNMDVIQQQCTRLSAEWAVPSPSWRDYLKTPNWRDNYFEAILGRMYVSQPERLADQPELLLRLFETCAARDLPPAAETCRLVQEFRTSLVPPLIYQPEINRRFEKLLQTWTENVDSLNEMLNCGFLEHFIPEFKAIRHRLEFNTYHLYPVDRHAIHTVRQLQAFLRPQAPTDSSGQQGDALELARVFMAELSDRHLLFWAGLLHDIGKGQTIANHAQVGAEMVADFFRQRSFDPAEISLLTFLVAEHRLLHNTATRRDIQDQETIAGCADRVLTPHRLKMLYLLTVADGLATGPKAWTDWAALLVTDLTLKILRYLESTQPDSNQKSDQHPNNNIDPKLAEEPPAQNIQAAIRHYDRSTRSANTVVSLSAAMSSRYLANMTPALIKTHIQLYEQLGQQPFTWHIAPSDDDQRRTLTICARDRPGLFSQIAGILTLNNINIFEAQVYTWHNRIALDVLTVSPPLDRLFESATWQKIAAQLDASLEGKLEIAPRLLEKYADASFKPPIPVAHPLEIRVDNHSSKRFTLLEIQADDFPGILFWITDALYRAGLDLRVAKIATQVDQIVNVFYVRDAQGTKLTDALAIEEMTALVRQAVLTAADHIFSK